MSEREQAKAFAEDLDRLVNRYRDEFELTYGSVVGVLFIKASLLSLEAEKGEGDEDQ
jgi:hypothetical protein